jgi:hypothetical protein
VLKQNKDDAKENDGGKANQELLAISIKQGFCTSIADTKFIRNAYSALRLRGFRPREDGVSDGGTGVVFDGCWPLLKNQS